MYFARSKFSLSPVWIFPIICAFCRADLPSGSDIVQCNVIYRHGDRTPVSEYPKSKFRNSSSWPDGWGQLSLKGMKQHFDFGRSLMKEYGPTGKKLVASIYNASQYKVYSTDIDRTIMSGLANSAGIYSLKPGEGIEDDVQWKPIPIRAVPADENDEIFAQFCPFARKTLKMLLSKKFMELRDANPKLFKYVEDHTGEIIISRPETIMKIYDTLECEKLTYDELPDWAEKIFPYPLQNYVMEFFKQYTSTERLRRLTAGPLLKTIINNMISKTKGEEIAKMHSYSAHDVHIFAILDSIGLPPQERPGYTSAVTVELYKSPEKDFFVQMLYRPGPDMEAKPLTIPGCDGRQFCPLNDFLNITAHLIPEDLKKECQSESL